MEQKLGNQEEAARKFMALLEEYPDTLYMREIQDRLSMLPKVDEPEGVQEEKASKIDNDSKKAG